jgi:hypothetical protein
MGDDPSVAVRGSVAAAHKRSASRKTPNIGNPRINTLETVFCFMPNFKQSVLNLFLCFSLVF